PQLPQLVVGLGRRRLQDRSVTKTYARRSGPLVFLLAAKQLRTYAARVAALVTDAMHRVGKWHVHTVALRQRTDRGARHHTFGHLTACRPQRLFERVSPAEVFAEGPVARQRRRTRRDEVADA